jgi:hypothetical protein
MKQIVFDIPGIDENVEMAGDCSIIPLVGHKIELKFQHEKITKKYIVRDIEFEMSKATNIYCDTIIIYLEERD